MGARPAGGVGVEPEDRHRGEPLGQQRLDLLGAGAGPRQGRRVAVRAGPRQRLGVGAVVADQPPGWRWTISETSQLGQPQWWPQERQVSHGAKPRRLTITIALAPAARTPSSASQVAGCRGPERGSASRMSSTSTGGIRGRRPGAEAPPAAAPATTPGAASRCRRPAPPRTAPPGGGRRCGRRSRDRPPACRRGRAPRRSRPGRGPRPGRRSPSAARRRRSPRRCAAAATRRSARRRSGPSAGRRSGRRAGRGSAPPPAGRGRSRGRGRSPPRAERRLDGGQVDLGLARAGDAVHEQLARRPGLAVEGGDEPSTAPARAAATAPRRRRADLGLEPRPGAPLAHAGAGGRTSRRPRAGVEQYSRATQRPSRTSSAGTPVSSASSGSTRRSGGSSELSAISTTTPSTRAARTAPARRFPPRPRPSPRAGGNRTGRATRGPW